MLIIRIGIFMLNCFTFFEDPLVNGKLKELIKRVNQDTNVISLLSIDQLNSRNEEKDIFLTNQIGLEKFKAGDFSNFNFTKTIVIDEIESSGTFEDEIIYINKKFLITGLGPILDRLIKNKNKESDHLPVPIKRLNSRDIYPCDFYIKISDVKYIKVSKAHSNIDASIMQKLIFKHINFLYIEKDHYEDLNKVLYRRSDDEVTAPASNVEINVVESLHNYVLDLGFDPKIVQMTKKLHNDIEERYKHKFMKKLFSRFKDMEGSFLYNHSYLTSVIALSVGKKLSWMSPDNREKIYMGCILHNLGYKDKNNAIYESLGRSEVLKLDKEIRDDVLNHPILFAKHLAQIDNIHQDVIKIVKDHHAVIKEESYPRAIGSGEINLIFALFVLSQQFTLGLFKINFKEEKIPVLLEEIKENFNTGNYKKILPEFELTIDEIFVMDQAA